MNNSTTTEPPCADTWLEETLIEGVLVPIIGLLGILGNILVLICYRYICVFQTLKSDDILCRRWDLNNSMFKKFIAILSVVDSLCIMTILVDQSMVGAWDLYSNVHTHLQRYLLPIRAVLFTLETYLITSIAFGRYLAVCRYVAST